MAFPNIATVIDDFTRANVGPPPSPDWGAPVFATTGELVVSSNLCAGTGGQLNDDYWATTMFGPDCEAYVDVPTLPGGASSIFLYLRLRQPGSWNGYALQYAQSVTTWAILRFDSNAGTVLGSGVSNTLAAGDSMGFEAVGGTLKGYKKTSGTWSEILSRSDSTYGESGYAGIAVDGTTGRLDNFAAGPPSVEVVIEDQVVVQSVAGGNTYAG